MVEAFLYVLDDDQDDHELGRLIMHRSYKDSDTSRVLKYMDQYVNQEQLNENRNILVRVMNSDGPVRHDLDLSDFQ